MISDNRRALSRDAESAVLLTRDLAGTIICCAVPEGWTSGNSSVGRASASQAEGRGFESRFPLQTNKIKARSDSAPPKTPQKADAHPENGFQAALEAFLLSRRVGNCSPRTVNGYAGAIQRFAQTLALRELRDATSLGIQRYLSGLRETMKPISVHDYFRPLKTFFRWCIEAGLLQDNPVRGITVRVPRTLPRVPRMTTCAALG